MPKVTALAANLLSLSNRRILGNFEHFQYAPGLLKSLKSPPMPEHQNDPTTKIPNQIRTVTFNQRRAGKIFDQAGKLPAPWLQTSVGVVVVVVVLPQRTLPLSPGVVVACRRVSMSTTRRERSHLAYSTASTAKCLVYICYGARLQ